MATYTSSVKTIRQFPFDDNLAMSRTILAGMPAVLLRALADALGLGIVELEPFVHIKERTLMRRVQTRGRLKPDESERMVRLMRIYSRAVDVLADEEMAKKWMSRPLRVLGNQSPLAAAATEPGAREVEHVLGRIENGVFS